MRGQGRGALAEPLIDGDGGHFSATPTGTAGNGSSADGYAADVEALVRGGSEFATLVHSLGTAKDTVDLRRRIAALREELTQSSKSTLASLRDWKPSSRADMVRRDRLLRQFEDAVSAFRASSQLSLRKERQHTPRESSQGKSHGSFDAYSTAPASSFSSGGGGGGGVATGRLGDSESLSELHRSIGGAAIGGGGGGMDGQGSAALSAAYEDRQRQQAQVHGNARFEAEMAAERNRELRALESDLADLGQVFSDCAALVQEQGKELDTIENEVTTAATRTEKGVEQLIEAGELQKKSRKKLCCLIFLFIAIGMAVMIPVLLKKGKKSSKSA